MTFADPITFVLKDQFFIKNIAYTQSKSMWFLFIYSKSSFWKNLGNAIQELRLKKNPSPVKHRKVNWYYLLIWCHFVIFQAGVMLISLRSVSRPDVISNNIFSQILEAFLCKGFDWKSGNQLNTSLEFD